MPPLPDVGVKRIIYSKWSCSASNGAVEVETCWELLQELLTMLRMSYMLWSIMNLSCIYCTMPLFRADTMVQWLRAFLLEFCCLCFPFIREVVNCWCFWLSTCNVRFSSSAPSTKPGKPWEKARTTASSALVATSDLSSPWVNPFGCWVAPYYNARKAFKIIQVKFMQVGFGMPWASIVML